MAFRLNKILSAFCALGLSAGVAVAQSPDTDSLSVPSYLLQGDISGLQLKLDERKSFNILAPPSFLYETGTGGIDFNVLGPLFCFSSTDAPGNSALLLTLLDGNGDLIVDGLGLESSLEYRLSLNEIRVDVPSSGACFYEFGSMFGVDGMAPAQGLGDNDAIFSDQFQATSDLQVEFIDVPAFVRPGETVTYAIEITNNGNLPASAVGFQELYPRNVTLYPEGQLQAGFYDCMGTGGADCADATPGLNDPSIRGRDISIPAGESIRFDIFRRVFTDSIIGGEIKLYAGAIDRGSADLAEWDAKTATMTVIGEGQSIVATIDNQTPPIADGIDEAEIRVTALDEFKNPTPDVAVQVSNADGLSFVSGSGVTGADGSIVFLARTVGAEAARSYTPEFLAPDIGANGSTAQVTVDFVAGEPDQFSAFTVTSDNTADGQDLGVIEVSVFDAFSNPVEGAEVTVQDNNGLNFINENVPTDEFGVATFQMTTTATGSYTPVFAQASIDDTTSSSITFEAGTAEALEFVTQPSDVSVGQAIDPPVVLRIVDEFGNVVDSDSSLSVTTQLRQNINGDDSAVGFFDDVTAVNGFVTLDNLVINDAGTGYYLRVFSDLPTVTSGSFEVTPIPQGD